MTVMTPVGGEASERIVCEAFEQLTDSTELVGLVMQDIRAGKLGAAKDLADAIRDMRKTFQTAIEERARFDKLRKDNAGIVNDYALDFDAARLEIGSRLARLRAAGGGG